MEGIGTSQLLMIWKAAGEQTRLRILALLLRGELNVTDLTRILDQSQPRISRHLRLLSEAGLIERFREGSFVYCRLREGHRESRLVISALTDLDPQDPVLATDLNRARTIRAQRAEDSQIWFQANAAEWDRIRALHVAESDVEVAMAQMLPAKNIFGGPFDLLLDLGTGTGRVLELFADRSRQAIGIDTSHEMLEYARSRLERKGLDHCQLRQGDLTDLIYEDEQADAVILHQVLHHMMEPEQVIREAARVLKPGGHLLLVDFAPHDLDFLRERYAHERLGFADEQIRAWLQRAGLDCEDFRQLAAPENGDPENGDPENGDRENGDRDRLTVSLWLAGRSNELTTRTKRVNA